MTKIEQKKIGFAPVYNESSRLLILGSFSSVKSREIGFYYGNKQNRFWKTVCGFFGEEIPSTVEGKKEFLFRRRIALWDVATSCQIKGSSDASLTNAEIADLSEVLSKAKIDKILLNGALAFRLFTDQYAELSVPYKKMPSTSPANPRFDAKVWEEELAYLR